MRIKYSVLLAISLLLGISARAQSTSITGVVVTEAEGEPVIGATIIVDGTKIGSTTDAEGRFTISNVPSDAKYVNVTYVGMKPVKAAIAPQMKVALVSAVEELDEVIVVAYGTAKKSSYAGSATLVKADAIKDIPTTTFENALNGAAHQQFRPGRLCTGNPNSWCRLDECRQRTAVCYRRRACFVGKYRTDGRRDLLYKQYNELAQP